MNDWLAEDRFPDDLVRVAEAIAANIPARVREANRGYAATVIARELTRERERCAAYHDEWERRHVAFIEEWPDDADFHREHALRHRVHAAAIRNGAA